MKKRGPDYILLGTIILLVGVGLVALLSASSIESQEDLGNVYSYLFHQVKFGLAAGIFLAFVCYKVDYKKWRAFSFPLLVLSIFLMVLVFIPDISYESGGAKRWISVYGISIQPAEFLKLGFIIYLAAWLDKRKNVLKKWSTGFVPFVAIISAVGVLIILQPDVGTLGVITMAAAVMYFIAGANFVQMSAIISLGIGLLLLLIRIAPYRLERLIAFLDPAKDPLGISYQINQALLAVGSGGLLGVGIGKSLQKYYFLPEPMKDSIFAIWAEESGFVGSALLLLLFVVFAFRGLKIAKNAEDRFGRLLASGITSWIILQVFVNIGSMLALTPLTGIPLPFISFGGSAMAASLGGAGILLNISKR